MSCTQLKTFTVVQNSYLTPSNNESIFSINFQEDKPEMKVIQGVWQVTKDCDWVAQSGGDGYENCTTTQIVKYEEPVLIKPFDMVVIADNSDFNLISGITDNTKKVTVIPTILLYYAHEKGQVENLKTYVQNTLDVVTLLVPVTKIATGPKWLAKTFTFVDKWSKVNAGVNLAVNNTPLNQIPEIKNALDAYNAVTAVMNVTTLAGAIGQNKIASFFSELDNPVAKKELLSQAKNGSDDAKKILDVEAELKAYSEAKLGKDWWKVNRAGNVFRGITKTQFFETVAEFKIPSNGLLGYQAWDLWKAKKWGELEDLFKANNINGKWPPNRGFIEFTTEPLTVGKEIDRYGGYIDPADGLFKDNGLYASPKGASFESRALPAEYLMSTPPKPYNKYKVVKEIPNVKQGQAAPWFNQPGMGTQYELPLSIDKLLSEGFIIKIN